jgi:hypothetical protein
VKYWQFYILGMIIEGIWVYGFKDNREPIKKRLIKSLESHDIPTSDRLIKKLIFLSAVIDTIVWPLNLLHTTYKTFFSKEKSDEVS